MENRRRILVIASQKTGTIFRAHPDSERHFRVTSQYAYHLPDIVRMTREEFARVVVIETPSATLDAILLKVAEDIVIESINDVLDLNLSEAHTKIVLIANVSLHEDDHAHCYLYHIGSNGIIKVDSFGSILPEAFWQSVIKTAIVLDFDHTADAQE